MNDLIWFNGQMLKIIVILLKKEKIIFYWKIAVKLVSEKGNDSKHPIVSKSLSQIYDLQFRQVRY